MPNDQTPDFIPAGSASSSASPNPPDFIPHVASTDFIPASPSPQSLPGASSMSAYQPSIWDRFKQVFTAGNPNYSDRTVNNPKYGQMQLASPEEAMTPLEQQRNPRLTGALEVAGSLTTPENTAIAAGSYGLFAPLGPTASAGMKVAPRVASGYFAYQGGKAAYDAHAQAVRASAAGNDTDAQRLNTQAGLSMLFGTLAATHTAVGNEVRTTPNTLEAAEPTDALQTAPTGTRADLVQSAGLVYKGELVPGADVHMFEDPAYPGKTAALKGPEMTSPAAIREAMDTKLAAFGVDPASLPNPKSLGDATGITGSLQQPSLVQRGFEKYADVRAHDPEIGDTLQQLDNAPKYFRAKAQDAISSILGAGDSRLSPEQEKLFTLLADSDSRENLRANHPEEFQSAISDPTIQAALERYKPFEQDLSAAREALGGKLLDGDYLARIYEDSTGERLPGTGQRRIGIMDENAPYAPERTASAEYFYQNGTHELEPSFAPKFVATNLRLIRDQLVENFQSKATKLEAGQQLPDTISYGGREYQKPDLSPDAKPSATGYSVYDGKDGRYIGPKPVVDALRNYDPVALRSGGKIGPIRTWMQKQILMGGAGIPHAFNILRRVASEAPLGVADPRGWINAAKVTFAEELRARGLRGLNDPTFDSLVKNGALAPNEMSELKRYWGGNLNPANWVESILRPGKKLLFEPGSLGGLGGLDQRARVGSRTASVPSARA